uniref:Proline rich 29 n=1 Tax=Suricata suricatta TaxID=37032 RepID=A0A673VHW3_SURSU
MAFRVGGSWGQPASRSAAPTESHPPTATPQCHRDCGCG